MITCVTSLNGCDPEGDGYASYWENLDERPTMALMTRLLKSMGMDAAYIEAFLVGWRRAKAEHTRLKRLIPPAFPPTGSSRPRTSSDKRAEKNDEKRTRKPSAAAKAPDRKSSARKSSARKSSAKRSAGSTKGKPGIKPQQKE